MTCTSPAPEEPREGKGQEDVQAELDSRAASRAP